MLALDRDSEPRSSGKAGEGGTNPRAGAYVLEERGGQGMLRAGGLQGGALC